MKKYTLVVTTRAWRDITDVYNHIHDIYKQPLTADRYQAGIIDKIDRLSLYAGSIAPSRYDYIQARYGPKARHITYKKMTIIYTIIDDTVLIKRVISGNLIR
jgi:plasmid stabilization system protein ParE